MGPIGGQEMVFIFILALVLFGPKKLPELGRTIGKALTEFRRASSDLKASFEREMHNLERETEAAKQSTNTIASPTVATPATYSDYEYPYYDESYGGSEPAANSSPVSASAVPGAESHGPSDAQPGSLQTDAAVGEIPKVAAVEGTVARSDTAQPEATPQHS
jgi:sec-independent protein translocase protein TatA